jgi:nitrite reductase/ring-hydroxylating ferredoxin subunit
MIEAQWRQAGLADDFKEGVQLVVAGKRPIVVARLLGKLYAFAKLCPHAGGDMDRCEVSGSIVSCPFHAWRFDLEMNGAEIHGYTSLRTFPVKTEDGILFVQI